MLRVVPDASGAYGFPPAKAKRPITCTRLGRKMTWVGNSTATSRSRIFTSASQEGISLPMFLRLCHDPTHEVLNSATSYPGPSLSSRHRSCRLPWLSNSCRWSFGDDPNRAGNLRRAEPSPVWRARGPIESSIRGICRQRRRARQWRGRCSTIGVYARNVINMRSFCSSRGPIVPARM